MRGSPSSHRHGPHTKFPTVPEKGEQAVADGKVALAQPLAVAVARLQREHRVQVPLQAATVFQARARLQLEPPPGQEDGTQQERLQARREHSVASLDGVAQVAQLVRQTDLPKVGMAALGTVEVGHPDRWPMPAQHLRDHGSPARRADEMDGELIVLEHPVPTGPAIDAHRGLVRADDARSAQTGEDGGDLVVEPRLGALEHGVQRPFAELEREQVPKQPGQPPVADGMGET
jgi:hypothetical protein